MWSNGKKCNLTKDHFTQAKQIKLHLTERKIGFRETELHQQDNDCM